MSPRLHSLVGGRASDDERPEQCKEHILQWEIGPEAGVVATPGEELEGADVNAAEWYILFA